MVDADTVWAEDANGTKLCIHLVGIDAPEIGDPRKGGGRMPGQPWGEEARRVLVDRVLKQPGRLEVHGRDRHGRVLGVIHYQGHTNITLWLVQSGVGGVLPGRAKRCAGGPGGEARSRRGRGTAKGCRYRGGN